MLDIKESIIFYCGLRSYAYYLILKLIILLPQIESWKTDNATYGYFYAIVHRGDGLLPLPYL